MVTAVPVEGLTEPVVEMVVSPAVDVAIGVVCASLIVVCAKADDDQRRSDHAGRDIDGRRHHHLHHGFGQPLDRNRRHHRQQQFGQ